MTDYAKMKNAELEALLKERGLAHTGKKAELVKRLQDHDAEGKKPEAASKNNEDEIDWDDELATDAKVATTEPAEAAVKAGGTGQPSNPQAVPNQKADIDPSTTSDLKVEAAPAANGAAEEAKPAKDFTSGIAETTLEEEIAKRKARAAKFGIQESSDEALKALERAKKFGGGGEISDKLNQALPERRERKRGNDADDSSDSRKRGRPGLRGGRRGSDRPASNRPPPAKSSNGASSWMSEADRAKAEARKAKFATAS